MLPLLRVALLLKLLAWIAVLVVYAIARTAGQEIVEQAAVLLQAPENCPPPCWQGIRPGETSSGDSIEQLGGLPWVTQTSIIQGIVSYDSIVRWSWQNPPPGINGSRDGRMWTHQGQVYLIELPLNLHLATVWNALGPPNWVEIIRSPQKPPAAFVNTYYDDGRLKLEAVVPCPVTWWRIWTAEVDAYFQEKTVLVSADDAGPLFPCG